MPVSRGRRVQVDPNIRRPAAETYRAVAVPHVGPQRKQSEASNFERLARDLGQFNSALQSFGSAVDGAAKRAEARAQKLEKERQAAAKREERAKKRAAYKASGGGRRRYSSGGRKKGRTREEWRAKKNAEFEHKYTLENESGTEEEAISGDPGTAKEAMGEENATKATYKELNEVKAGIGKDVYLEQKAKLRSEKEDGFMINEEDEHGEPVMGPDGKPKQRLLTQPEIKMEAYKQQKAIDKQFAEKPLVRRHLKYQNVKNMEARLTAQERAEAGQRKSESLEFVANTTMDGVKQMQAEGMDPDTISKVAQAKAVADARLLYPNASRDEIDSMMVDSAERALESGDINDARAAINFLQGSPNREGGVGSWLRHPKHVKKAERIVRKASKIVVEQQAKTKAVVIGKQFVKAYIEGKTLPPINSIEETLNGKKHRITVDEIKAGIGETIDQKYTTLDGAPLPPEKRAAMLPKLIDAYQGLPTIKSPALSRALMFNVKRDEKIDPKDPTFGPAAATAMTMFQKGKDGAAVLKRHTSPTMYRFYEQMWALRRNGHVEEDEVVPMMNTWLDHARRGGLRPTLGSMENKLTHLPLPGLTKTQREMVMNTARLAVIDKNLTYDQVAKVMLDQAETFREYNPEYNGVTVEMDPALGITSDQFESFMDDDVREFRMRTGVDKEIYVQREGNKYVYYDKETETPVRNPKTGAAVGFTAEKLLSRVAAKQERMKNVQDAQTRENKRYSEAGGHWGAFLRGIGWEEELDVTEDQKLIEKQKAEMAEFEKIVNERD